jgi:hypothetical protein
VRTCRQKDWYLFKDRRRNCGANKIFIIRTLQVGQANVMKMLLFNRKTQTNKNKQTPE